MDESEMHKFKRILKKLSSFSGSGTELISVYIPAGYPIHEVSAKLRNELSQASNIKSKKTRTNVMAALEKIIGHLKLYRETPKNGLCVFAGNVSKDDRNTDIKLFSFEPPFEIKMNIYRCSSSFFLDPLMQLSDSKDTYGVVVLDGREATLAVVRGTDIKIIKSLNSLAHSKIRKGGQSAARYQRLIEESIDKYYKRVGEAMDEHFLQNGIKGVIIAGPGPTKEFFYKARPFNYQIKILGVVDTGYTDEYGVREALSKAESILAEQEITVERQVLSRFMKAIATGGLVTYGISEVLDAFRSKRAELVIVSEKLQLKRIIWKCEECGSEEEEISDSGHSSEKQCKKCGAPMSVVVEEDLIDYFLENSKEFGVDVKVVSTNTSEGAQFFHGFGGLGAFLRY